MKIKEVVMQQYDVIPSECQHEFRLFGTRLHEEVWTPVRTGPPPEYPSGWVICDKCGWSPYATKYKRLNKRDHVEPLLGNWPDWMVEVIEFSDCSTPPTELVVEKAAYAEFSWWDKMKSKIKKLLWN